MIQPHSNKVGAVVFAGGVGRRMNAHGIPKQFLEINGKPIIISIHWNFLTGILMLMVLL